jgi:hypothetical protein
MRPVDCQRTPLQHHKPESQEMSTDRLPLHRSSAESMDLVLEGLARCHCKARYLRMSLHALAGVGTTADNQYKANPRRSNAGVISTFRFRGSISQSHSYLDGRTSRCFAIPHRNVDFRIIVRETLLDYGKGKRPNSITSDTRYPIIYESAYSFRKSKS